MFGKQNLSRNKKLEREGRVVTSLSLAWVPDCVDSWIETQHIYGCMTSDQMNRSLSNDVLIKEQWFICSMKRCLSYDRRYVGF